MMYPGWAVSEKVGPVVQMIPVDAGACAFADRVCANGLKANKPMTSTVVNRIHLNFVGNIFYSFGNARLIMYIIGVLVEVLLSAQMSAGVHMYFSALPARATGG